MGTVLVTGAAGFVGQHLLRALVDAENDRKVVAWRRPPDTGGLSPTRSQPQTALVDHPSLRWETVDILDRAAVGQAVAEAAPAEIYHCAGAADVRGSWTNTLTPLSVNVRGTQYLLEAVAGTHPRARVLIPGSALIYRPAGHALAEDDPIGPVSPYGVSKLAQEMLGRQCADTGTAVLLTRSFTHLGPGQAPAYAASSFAQQIARIEAGLTPPFIDVGSLTSERDLTDVRDTVQAYLLLMAAAPPGRPYNVCSGTAYPIQKVLDRLVHHAKVDVTIRTAPDRLRPRDNHRLLGNPARIAEEIGWRPRIALDTTLRDLLDHWRQLVSRAQTH